MNERRMQLLYKKVNTGERKKKNRLVLRVDLNVDSDRSGMSIFDYVDSEM